VRILDILSSLRDFN